MKYKTRVFEIVEIANEGDKISKIFDVSIIIIILLNILSMILESFENIRQNYMISSVLLILEISSVLIFTIEYIIRVWTANLKYKNKKTINAVIKHIFSFSAIIDLLAILPFYLPLLIAIDLRFLRLLRLGKFFRVIKLGKYSKALNKITRIIADKKEELIASVSLMLLIVLFSSFLMYYFENPVQPEKFNNILSSCWWAIATLTTVGYGDIYPITSIGKILAVIISISGIGIVALPTGIISSGFMDLIKKERILKCPYCGKDIKSI